MMLHAALNYIQETSRMGWHEPGSASGIMREAFGWTDVRDGEVGPRDQFKEPLWTDTDHFPQPGGKYAARFPMYVMQQPPFAMRPVMAPNPFDPDSTWTQAQWERDAGPDLRYSLTNLPEAPVSATLANEAWAARQPFDANVDFRYGDQNPRPDSQGMAWFRVYRESPGEHDGEPGNVVNGTTGRDDEFDVVDLSGHHGIFIVTCGAGGTMGFKDYKEAEDAPGGAPFDEVTFENLRATERILWYRVEWTGSDLPGTYSDINNPETNAEVPLWNRGNSFFNTLSRKRSPPRIWRNAPMEGGSVARNPIGTIEWIMRLEREPPNW